MELGDSMIQVCSLLGELLERSRSVALAESLWHVMTVCNRATEFRREFGA
jgi:hypothetical protein